MPDLTPRLGIKKPLGNENVTRENFNENWDIIDLNSAKKSDLVGHQAERATPTTLGHVKAETDAEGNLILPEMSASNVTTAGGSNVQTEIDSLKSSVSDGKTQIETAITGKGGAVSKAGAVATFEELEAGVNGITSKGKFVKTGDVSGITFKTTYQRTTIAKNFLYSQDSDTTTIGVTNLDTNQIHATFVNNTNYVDFIKSDRFEDCLYGYRTGNLKKLDQDYNLLWNNTALTSLYWNAVTFDDLYVYAVSNADSKIRKINRLTGVTELTSPSPVSGGASGALIVQKELNRIVYVISSSSGVYFSIFKLDDLTVIRNFSNSNTTGTYTYGGFFTKSLRYLYYFVTSSDNIVYLCIVDTNPATPLFLTNRPIAFPVSSVLEGSLASIWTDKGFVINASNNTMIVSADDTNELSFTISGVYDKAYNKNNGHRYIGIDTSKNLSHGIYS